MKIYLMICLLVFSGRTSYGQQLHSVRFVHVGNEDKPIGTLVISVEKLIKPQDRPGVDEVIGQSIKTDIKSFNQVLSLVTTNKYLAVKATKTPAIKIVINDVTKLYLDEHFVSVFFKGLIMQTNEKNVDKAVVKKLSELKRRLI